jgi:hypothetical protein
MHNAIGRSFNPYVISGVTISVLPPGQAQPDWWRRASGSEIAFDMYLADRGERQEFALREPTIACPVVCLGGQATVSDHAWWVSWHERWRAGQKGFALIDAGMGFFWGQRNAREKTLVLRVEWAGALEDIRTAPQPHWHVHWEREFLETLAVAPAVDPELEELQEMEATRQEPMLVKRTLKDVHLGMAGWELRDRPSSWQRCVGGDLGTVELWAVTTLKYLSEELLDDRHFRMLR